jgi:hypothetical protein
MQVGRDRPTIRSVSRQLQALYPRPSVFISG